MRVIDADEAIINFGFEWDDIPPTREEFVYFLKKQPAVDVVPVRNGRWIFGKDLPYSWGQTPKNKYHLYCSECLEQAFNRSEDNDPDFDVDTPYCPNCGAMMHLPDEYKQEEGH